MVDPYSSSSRSRVNPFPSGPAYFCATDAEESPLSLDNDCLPKPLSGERVVLNAGLAARRARAPLEYSPSRGSASLSLSSPTSQVVEPPSPPFRMLLAEDSPSVGSEWGSSGVSPPGGVILGSGFLCVKSTTPAIRTTMERPRQNSTCSAECQGEICVRCWCVAQEQEAQMSASHEPMSCTSPPRY